MSLTRWLPATAAALTLGLLGGGAFLAHGPPAARQAPAQPAPATALPPDKGTAPAVTLRWQFEKGQPFYQEMTTETNQTMIVMNDVVKQTQKQTFRFRWTPLRQAGGDWILQTKVEGVKMDIDIAGQKIQFDSTQEKEAPGPLADWCKSLVGAKFQVTLDDEGKVREVGGDDALRGELTAANPALAVVIDQVLGKAALRKWAEQSLDGLPDEPVRPGDCWTSSRRLRMDPLGEYRVKLRYTYQGPEGRLERIKVESTLQWQPFVGSGTDLPFQVKKGLVAGRGRGTILFDRDRGRVARKELSWEIDGKLTVGIGKQETEVSISQTQSTTVQSSDRPTFERASSREEDRKEIERLREENERLRRRLKAVEEALRRDSKPGE
jgi:hypothetical protein